MNGGRRLRRLFRARCRGLNGVSMGGPTLWAAVAFLDNARRQAKSPTGDLASGLAPTHFRMIRYGNEWVRKHHPPPYREAFIVPIRVRKIFYEPGRRRRTKRLQCPRAVIGASTSMRYAAVHGPRHRRTVV